MSGKVPERKDPPPPRQPVAPPSRDVPDSVRVLGYFIVSFCG